MPSQGPRRRRKTIELVFRCGGQATSVRVPLDVDPHTLVVAAWDRFLPVGVLPTRLMRDEQQLAFYDPLRNLATEDIRDGDVLECELDQGQTNDEPTMLRAYRVMREYAAASFCNAGEFGHLKSC